MLLRTCPGASGQWLTTPVFVVLQSIMPTTMRLNTPHAQASSQGFLLLSPPKGPEKRMPLTQKLYVLGRAAGNDIVLPDDPYVSSQHASIEKVQGRFLLRDMGSSNGSFVNGQPVLKSVLQHNDTIKLGMSTLHFRQHSHDQNAMHLKSSHPAWQKQLSQLPQMGQSDLPVLIEGPSGTGKEALAQYVHAFSPRKNRPLVVLNCSSLNEQLVESELFGHSKGSFTGAERARRGAFMEAHRGTLFLDEIGDLPLNLQPKLLRALENKEIKAVGSDAPSFADVRIISATCKNLTHCVEKGLFRPDLFFRLNVLRLNPPALKDRPQDLMRLARHFARESGLNIQASCETILQKHAWPGNVRELKNFIARARTMLGPNATLCAKQTRTLL